jgi:hypothetical protein
MIQRIGMASPCGRQSPGHRLEYRPVVPFHGRTVPRPSDMGPNPRAVTPAMTGAAGDVTNGLTP